MERARFLFVLHSLKKVSSVICGWGFMPQFGESGDPHDFESSVVRVGCSVALSNHPRISWCGQVQHPMSKLHVKPDLFFL